MATQSQLTLLSGEQILTSTGNGDLTLTTIRVVYASNGGGESKFIGIPLDAISCCSLVTRSQPILLVLAALAGLAAFSGQLPQEGAIASSIAALFLVAAYFTTRRARLTVSPKSGEDISLAASGMKREDILSFLNLVTQARHDYISKTDIANSV